MRFVSPFNGLRSFTDLQYWRLSDSRLLSPLRALSQLLQFREVKFSTFPSSDRFNLLQIVFQSRSNVPFRLFNRASRKNKRCFILTPGSIGVCQSNFITKNAVAILEVNIQIPT